MPKSTTGTATIPKGVSAQIIYNETGKEIGVFIPIKTFRKMLKDLEDSYDFEYVPNSQNDEGEHARRNI